MTSHHYRPAREDTVAPGGQPLPPPGFAACHPPIEQIQIGNLPLLARLPRGFFVTMLVGVSVVQTVEEGHFSFVYGNHADK